METTTDCEIFISIASPIYPWEQLSQISQSLVEYDNPPTKPSLSPITKTPPSPYQAPTKPPTKPLPSKDELLIKGLYLKAI